MLLLRPLLLPFCVTSPFLVTSPFFVTSPFSVTSPFFVTPVLCYLSVLCYFCSLLLPLLLLPRSLPLPFFRSVLYPFFVTSSCDTSVFCHFRSVFLSFFVTSVLLFCVTSILCYFRPVLLPFCATSVLTDPARCTLPHSPCGRHAAKRGRRGVRLPQRCVVTLCSLPAPSLSPPSTTPPPPTFFFLLS